MQIRQVLYCFDSIYYLSIPKNADSTTRFFGIDITIPRVTIHLSPRRAEGSLPLDPNERKKRGMITGHNAGFLHVSYL